MSSSISETNREVLLRGIALLAFIGFLLMGLGFLWLGYASSAPLLKLPGSKAMITTRSRLTSYGSLSLVIIGAILASFSLKSIAKESGWKVIGDGANVWAAYFSMAAIFYTIGLGFKVLGAFTGLVSRGIVFYSMVDALIALILVFLTAGRLHNPLFAIGRLKGGKWVAPTAKYGLMLGAVLLPVGIGGFIVGIVLIIIGIMILIKASKMPVR